MKNLSSVEKLLKRCFKEKITVTTATMVAFLITGTAVLGATYTGQYTAGDNTIESGTVLDNEGKDGTVNIWEDPNANEENQVTLTNEGTIKQIKGTGKAIAAINIANAADFTNNGIISVDREGNDVGSAISQGFGGLVGNNPSTSSSIVNEEAGKIEVKNVAIATGIGADGYKKENSNEGKNDISIKNDGEIKINSLTKKELTTGELNIWNFLNGSKYKTNTITGSGSIGAGIVAGNLVSVENTGNIDIANENPMVITGTLKNGEIVSTKIGGVGIASAHDINKSKDGKTRVTVNNSGTINMTGNYMLGIATAGQVDTINSGTVEVIGKQGVGILIGEGGTLKNTGTIIATGEGSKAVLGSSADDVVTLGTGSHIEGIIDLAGGTDTVNIDGVRGENGTAEIINTVNVEQLNVNNSNIEFIGKIETSETAVVLNNKDGNNKFTNSGKIIAETGIMIANAGQDGSTDNQNVVEMTNGQNGIIEAKVFAMYNNGYNTKYNPTQILNDGEILINDYVETTSGEKPYIYSNGIYSANRPNAVEKGYVENTGNITVEVNEEKNNRAKELYEQSEGNMFANIQGIRLHENTEGYNSGKISVKTHTGVGVALTAGDTGANGIEDYGYFQNNGTVETLGDYTIGVQVKNSTTAKLNVLNDTNGVIKINGEKATGISVKGNAEAINKGTIALNVFGEDESYSGNIAMKGEDGAVISSTGTIQLTDLTVEKLNEKKMEELQDFVDNTLMIGGNHTGIVTNFRGDTILAAGDSIVVPDRPKPEKPKPEEPTAPTLGNLEADEVKKSDDTVNLVGGKLDGVLNIGEGFQVEDGKFLAKVESEELNIGGTINAGNANGIDIGEGNKVNLTGSINSGNTAINLGTGASLAADGASIKGDITSTGDSSEITLVNSTKLSGNIILGDGDDKLTIDSSTGNLFGKGIVIDGGSGKDTLNLGTEGKVTTIKGTISNFDNQLLTGVVVLESDAKITADKALGNVTLGDDSLLVVRVSGDKDHAFTDIAGNSVSTQGNGKVMLETNNLNIGSEGATIDLAGTKMDIAEEDIIASQYIYDITFAPVRMAGSLLNISLKSLDSMNINSKYQGVFDSIVTSGNLSAISNSTALGKESALENLLGQVVEMNPYSLSMKMSRDSMMGWNNGIRSLKNMPGIGEWMVQATGTGNYENYKGTVGHESDTTGLLATGEYGIMKDTSLGFAFGGGKQSGELKDNSSDLESDSFYFGAFAKKNIENFRLLGSLGYQKNKFDGKRVLDNGLDRFDFDKSFDTEGFSLMGEARYIKPINETLTLEPKLVLDYTQVSQDSINEGGRPMGISVDSAEQNTYGAELGIDLVKNFSGIKGQSGKMYAGVAYGYTGGDIDESLEARIGNGSKFDIEGVDIGNSRGKATVGIELENGKGFNYGVGYTYEAGKDTKNSKVTLGLGYKF